MSFRKNLIIDAVKERERQIKFADEWVSRIEKVISFFNIKADDEINTFVQRHCVVNGYECMCLSQYIDYPTISFHVKSLKFPCDLGNGKDSITLEF